MRGVWPWGKTSTLPAASSVPSVAIYYSHLRHSRRIIGRMKIKVIVHPAEEGGFWAEVPAIPGCATQGETFEELLQNLYEAVEGCLSVDISPIPTTAQDRVLEIVV